MGKEQELVQSIRTNDVESFRKIIAKFKSKSKKASKKTSLHIVDHDGFIPLHHAALSGNGEIVMALLEFTTDVNAKDKKGMTPLHLAAWAGKVEPALLLLDAGAQTNLCSRSGATPLHLASEHGNYGVVERLVDHDCDPTVVNNHGETALDLACRFGHLEVVRILLNNSRGKCEKLLNPKEFQEKASPLHMAAKTGHFDVVKLLIECGADINQRGPTGSCLHEAALYGKTDVVKYLVGAGIDVNLKNREGQTALDIVTQFTKSGASSEIKHILREASVEVVYAKAIKDYANITDDSFLTLRLGDIVLVLDRRKDGLWKGCVRDDQKERIGFFPSSVVQVLRSPSRNSVKRSSSCSSEASKASTVGTISNSFEIVTVAPPSQPVANKSRAPRMSSFRKKAGNKTESDERSSRTAKNGEAPRKTGENGRPSSEHDVEEKKKKLNYLDIVVVENHNKKSVPPPATATKTEYADVFLPNSTAVGDSTDGKTGFDSEGNKTEGKDIGRTNEAQKSVRVNGSYARLGKQVFGNQGTEDNEKLRQELQKQQEDRLRRQQMRQEQENRQNIQDETEKQQQQQQSFEAPTPEEKRSSSETNLSPNETSLPLPIKSRHNTMSSLVTHSQDLPPLPLKKRHSVSGSKPSVPAVADPVLPPKQDKKLRVSFRADRRTTSPPPPPPPPPTGSSTPSPIASSNVSPHSTPRSPSPPLPTLPKPMEVSPLSPTLITTKSPFKFSKKPVPAPSNTSPPDLQASQSLPPPSEQPARSPSPSFPPPPPAISEPTDSTPPIPTVTVNSHLSVDPHVDRSPSPPLPPPPVETLTSPSMSSLGDFPPPPPTLMENTPDVDQTLPSPPQMGSSDSTVDPGHPPHKSDSLEPETHAALHPPTSSQSYSGYEDMTRLKRTWTKTEVTEDKKGYVMVNPVKRPVSPVTASANPNAQLKPMAVSSMLYENFIPLKTRHFEVRKLDGSKNFSSSDMGGLEKPEKPSRHGYVNCEPGASQHEIKQHISGESGDTNQDSKDDTKEKSIPGTLPVLRVPPVPQVPADPPSTATNPRMREYDDLYDWLAQSKLLAYIDNFAAAGFDLPAMAGLTGEDLSEIQITKTGHRKRLLSEATKLSMPAYSYENNVPSWLKSLGLSLYENHFIEGGFDDMEFLYDLTKEDLEAIGVTKIGHQRKILMATKKLQQRDGENQATNTNIAPDHEREGEQLPYNDVTTVGVTRVYADERVGEYAVPRVSHFAGRKTGVIERDERREFESSEEQISFKYDVEESSDHISTESESTSEFIEEDTGNTDFTDEMNGNVTVDSTDGVRELAASFQHAIHEETAKAKGKPPPVKPKSYKKAPPPVVAPKPKANGVKIHEGRESPTEVNAKIDFTEVIKEAEALSESGSEQSPPSTLGRDRKSESGVSMDSSLAGSQGSLNSESDELQREIRDSLHRKPSSGSSVDDITKLTYLTLSQEDLLEQQKREEELEKYQKEQNKTDLLFNDIQGMLDNLNSELDDMFK